MPLRKDNPIWSPVNGFLVDLPSPSNISYFWNFGSLLGLCLVLQIITGCFLSMHYCSDVCLAFASIGHIMRDVNYGFLLRYLHANGASLFFLSLYSYWTGVILRGVFEISCLECWCFAFFLLTMATAFMGYVLPWHQRSFWGATVITNLLSAIPYFGVDIVQWVWGGFSVSWATLNRFFSLHFLLPFILVFLAIIHLVYLHIDGSNNPIGLKSSMDNVSFHTFYTSKDLFGFFFLFILFLFFVFWGFFLCLIS